MDLMALTVEELDAMDAGQIVLDEDGDEWRKHPNGMWWHRGASCNSKTMAAGGIFRQKGWPPFTEDDAERARNKGKAFTLPSLHVEQPMPTASTGASMHYLAADVLNERYNLGLDRYGQPLRAMNGRDAVRDTIEELADGLAYALQIREERRLLRAELLTLRANLTDDPDVEQLTDIITRYFPEES